MKKLFVMGFVMLILSGCGKSTRDLKAVEEFDLNKYAGKWYEIARLDNRFEKDLIGVTAFYKIEDNGQIEVINRGFNETNNTRQVAKGTAKFIGKSTVGHLEVTFFYPFYSGYKILELDKNYDYALVTSDSFDYLWILARDPALSDITYQMLVDKAQKLGFNTSALIKISHLCGC
jgi:apolipoprotein D and lipocalin family protein